MPESGLLFPASPTRITPVLVTAGAALVAVATLVSPADGEDVPGVAEVGVAGLDVILPDGVEEPPMFPPLWVWLMVAVVGGAEV